MQCVIILQVPHISDRYVYQSALLKYSETKALVALSYGEKITSGNVQGRAMDELAQKVFHVLNTDPENFESEFSGTRRRSGRRCQSKAKDCAFNSNARTSTNFRTVSVPNDISSKEKRSHLSNSKRKLRGYPLVARTGACRDQYNLFSGKVLQLFQIL